MFNTSLLRFSEAQKAVEVGREYLFSPDRDTEVGPPGDFKFSFETTVPGAAAPHVLALDFRPDETGLYRIAAMIGRNGTGKTQLLAQFAKAMSGLANEETDPPWNFKPARPGFSRVMALSFSAFDDFERPRAGRSFSYTYCGLRHSDEPTEAAEALEREDVDAVVNVSDEQGAAGESAEYGLRSAAEMREALQRALARIGDLGRAQQWGVALTTVFGETVDLKSVVARGRLVPNGFARLSSGQRMVMLVLSELVAGLEEEAMLFDEPELSCTPTPCPRSPGLSTTCCTPSTATRSSRPTLRSCCRRYPLVSFGLSVARAMSRWLRSSKSRASARASRGSLTRCSSSRRPRKTIARTSPDWLKSILRTRSSRCSGRRDWVCTRGLFFGPSTADLGRSMGHKQE